MDLFGEDLKAEPAAEPDSDSEIESSALAGTQPAELFSHPRRSRFLLGHEKTEQSLLKNFYKEKTPHAIIFSGIEGIGKASLAYRYARFLLAHGPGNTQQETFLAMPKKDNFDLNPEDPVFRRVASGGHPDLMVVERYFDEAKGQYNSGIETEKIRKIAPFLRMTASAGGWRLVIVDDADTMNRNAQNALLKILEEPPARTVLMLVAHRAGALIPTIRSRAQVINMQPLSHETMHALFEKSSHSLSQAELEMILALSEGSFGRALQLAEEGCYEMMDRITVLFKAYPAWSWPEIHSLADTLARKGQENNYRQFRDQMLWILRALTKSKAKGEGAAALGPAASIENVMRNMPLKKLLYINENLAQHFHKVETANLDKRYGVIGCFSVISA